MFEFISTFRVYCCEFIITCDQLFIITTSTNFNITIYKVEFTIFKLNGGAVL